MPPYCIIASRMIEVFIATKIWLLSSMNWTSLLPWNALLWAIPILWWFHLCLNLPVPNLWIWWNNFAKMVCLRSARKIWRWPREYVSYESQRFSSFSRFLQIVWQIKIVEFIKTKPVIVNGNDRYVVFEDSGSIIRSWVFEGNVELQRQFALPIRVGKTRSPPLNTTPRTWPIFVFKIEKCPRTKRNGYPNQSWHNAPELSGTWMQGVNSDDFIVEVNLCFEHKRGTKRCCNSCDGHCHRVYKRKRHHRNS